MRLFAVKTGGEKLSRKRQTELGRALLRYAVFEVWGEPCPETAGGRGEKPCFPGVNDRFFSISHTRGLVLVGVSEKPVGVDAEAVRPVRSGLERRLFSAREREQFSFFEGWTLRESVFKLMGSGSLMSMELSLDGETVKTPFEGVRCRVYREISGFVVSAAAFEADFPEKIELLPPNIIVT